MGGISVKKKSVTMFLLFMCLISLQFSVIINTWLLNYYNFLIFPASNGLNTAAM